ncbi:hypothetical protein JCM33374_g6389 [Metschnikowia sp. JCM 33374]|nr:hypothetical protein JCM33374_g6389 [Metschnikowia sp. JCM 33374]
MSQKKCLLKIENALFSKVASRPRKYIFPNPISNFKLWADVNKPTFWGVIGPRKSDFLRIVASKYFSEPALGRSYPFLSKGGVLKIQYIDFRENSGLDKCHMAARYETYSFKGKLEMSDDVNSVQNYISGENNYNKNKDPDTDPHFTESLLAKFELSHLKNKWINTLSNGQMRRARIAKAIHTKPQILVIDDPFLGLDPKATKLVSESLKLTALELNFSIVLGLRTLDEVPDWITNLAVVDENGLSTTDENYSAKIQKHNPAYKKTQGKKHPDYELSEISPPHTGRAFIEFNNASVIYKNVPVLENFNWKVNKGSTWRIMGENGSGKTTILSLITAEHPQSWRSVLSIDAVVRKPGNGVNYFDINNKIGISSPELHAVVPFGMPLGQVILNGLIPDIGNSNFRVLYKNSVVPPHAQSILDHFELELENKTDLSFNELSVSLQKLSLFLRAILKGPDILILDEAFSGMDEHMVFKCHAFIEKNLKDTTILTIGHLDWEVPMHDFVIKLEAGSDSPVKFFATK